MKLFKYFFLLILILVLGVAAYIGLSKGQYQIEKTVKIQAPKELVFEKLTDFKDWKNWLPQVDSTYKLSFDDTQLSYKQPISGISFILSTLSKTHYSAITQKAVWKKQYGTVSFDLNWQITMQGDQSYVTLELKADQDYWAKAVNLFTQTQPQQVLEKHIEESLAKFKKYIAKEMAVYNLTINGTFEAASKSYFFYSLSSKTNPAQIQAKREKAYTVFNNTPLSGISSASPLVLFYNKIDSKHHNAIISFAKFSSGDSIIPPEDSKLLLSTTTGGLTLKATLTGNYSNIPKLWEKAKVYMYANGLTQDQSRLPYEIYKRDATTTKNPAKWITELYIPVIPK